ncbi:MAG: hypothetical protein WD075_05205 [Rhodospirillales bacterium]
MRRALWLTEVQMFGNTRDPLDRIIESAEITRADVARLDINAAYLYWDALRQDAVGPPQSAFKLDALPPRLVPCLAVIDFVGPPLDYYYRFFGSSMVEAAGKELTGKTYYKDKVQGYGFVNARLFPVLIEQRQPLFHRTIWESVKRVRLQTTSLRLPLSNDGVTVTGAVTANDYKFV